MTTAMPTTTTTTTTITPTTTIDCTDIVAEWLALLQLKRDQEEAKQDPATRNYRALLDLYAEATSGISVDKFRTDQRLLDIWLDFLNLQWLAQESVDEIRDKYKFLKSRLGCRSSRLFVQWAVFEYECGRRDKAIGILKTGLTSNATPTEPIQSLLQTLESGALPLHLPSHQLPQPLCLPTPVRAAPALMPASMTKLRQQHQHQQQHHHPLSHRGAQPTPLRKISTSGESITTPMTARKPSETDAPLSRQPESLVKSRKRDILSTSATPKTIPNTTSAAKFEHPLHKHVIPISSTSSSIDSSNIPHLQHHPASTINTSTVKSKMGSDNAVKSHRIMADTGLEESSTTRSSSSDSAIYMDGASLINANSRNTDTDGSLEEPPRPSQKLLRLLEMTPHVPSPSKPDNNTESLIEESEQPSVENPPCEPQTQIEKSFAPNKSNCNAGSNVPATHLARRSSDCNIVPPSQLLAPPPPPPPKSQTRAIHSARLPLQASQISNLTPASAVQPKTHYSGSSNSSNMHSQETVKQKSLLITVNSTSYRKIEIVGRGASSKVYKVISESGQIYALKKVKLDWVGDPAAVEGYLNEIELLKKLAGTDCIIKLIDAEVERDRKFLYMILEFGEIDLAHLLTKEEGSKIGDLNFVRMYWSQMLKAVQCIHDENVIHSDLKPANFILVEGTLKLIDFGIAKSIPNDTTNIHRDCQTGTLNYMAPEALVASETNSLQGKLKLGRASDIWSLGCILYQLVYGRPPFAQLPIMQKLNAIPDPDHKIKFPAIEDPSLIEVMQSCLNRDPKQRPKIPDLLIHESLHPRRSPPIALHSGAEDEVGWAGIRVEVVIKIIEEARRSDQDARVLAERLIRDLNER